MASIILVDDYILARIVSSSPFSLLMVQRDDHRPCGFTSLYHGALGFQTLRREACKKTKCRLRQTTSHSSPLDACQGDVSCKLNQPFLLFDLSNLIFCRWRTFRYIKNVENYYSLPKSKMFMLNIYIIYNINMIIYIYIYYIYIYIYIYICTFLTKAACCRNIEIVLHPTILSHI